MNPSSRAQVEQLALQIERATKQLRERIEGLTDGEYFWEPVSGCWSVRPREAATSPHPMGSGPWVLDNADEEPPAAPFTTIAWRLIHLTDVFDSYQRALWVHPYVDIWIEIPSTAAGGIALWEHHAATFVKGLEGEDGESLQRPVRVPWWPREAPKWAVVSNVATEAIHHGAEIGVLRDLYAKRAELRP